MESYDWNMRKMTLDTLAVIVQKGFEKSAADLEQLAIMVQRGFEETTKNFVSVREDISTTKNDLYELSERVGHLEQRVEYGFDMMTKRFDEIDVRSDVFDLQLRMGKVEKRLKTK